eukprot:TRINITY_DN4409_c0_g1_i2.p1 TRINITY_DN4409_c0_g1~~TRINITY_DN4409_c0_g1_i2.p1  ORF type:complete len:310 (+),score=70.96 TRINITY_DN4409_c0_g1_i2:39-968(+)
MCRHPHIAEQCLSCRRLTCLSAQHFTLLADAADGGCSLTADEMFQRLAALMSSPTAGGGAVDDLAVRMCLHGVPAEHRPVLWPLLSGAGRARAAHPAGFYARLCGERVDAAVSAEIAKDFGRCYPDEPGFGRSGEGTRVLGRVLHAFAAMEPKVGYTQGMAFLVGLLLMEGLAEEDAFWVFVSLVSNKRWDMRAIYAPELDRAGWNSRCRDMLHVTARRVPGLVHWARLTNTEAEALLLPFIPSVFANRLPLRCGPPPPPPPPGTYPRVCWTRSWRWAGRRCTRSSARCLPTRGSLRLPGRAGATRTPA